VQVEHHEDALAELQHLRSRLAEDLGVPSRELPSGVVTKAAYDHLYLHHLLACRGDQFMLSLLFSEAESAPEAPGRSNSALLRSAASAALKWIAAGATFVDSETYQRRLGACRTCPHLRPAPPSGLYKLLGAHEVCELCGCDVEKKAKLGSEGCPDLKVSEHGRW
jgi:hypothetical protein